MMYEQVLSWWSCQSPFAHSCSFLNHSNSFWGGMLKLNAKFDADSLLHSLSHFDCESHTEHMLTQWHLLSPLTNTMKSSLFTDAHSSPLSLAARLHSYHVNCFHYIFLKDFIYLFLESGEGREKERERNILCGCLSHTPYLGPDLQPRHMPQLGIEPATHWFTGLCSIHWATPAGLFSLY